MGQMIGADVEELERLALQFDQSATRLRQIAASVRQGIRVSAWVGPAAVHFRVLWDSQHSARLRSAADEISTAATALRRNAAEQRAASNSLSGSAGSAVAAQQASSGSSQDTWVDAKDPKVELASFHKTLHQGERYTIHPAPGSTETAQHDTADVDGNVALGKDGLTAFAGASAVWYGATSTNNFKIAGENAELGYEDNVGADATATATVGRSGGSANVQAMVGATAEASGSIGDDNARATGTAGLSAGLGAQAHANASFKDGKLKIGAGLGAAVGVGGKVGGTVEINVSQAERNAQHAATSVLNWVSRR